MFDFLIEPQFCYQTKDKLNNPEVRSLLESICRPVATAEQRADALIEE